MRGRSAGLSVALVCGSLAAGLVVRFAPLGLPGAVVKYGGSAFWALLIYWVVSAMLGSRRIMVAVVVACLLAAAVELLKLFHTPELDAFRLTLPGMLLLGRFFSVQAIAVYWVAIGIGGMVDKALLPPPVACPES